MLFKACKRRCSEVFEAHACTQYFRRRPDWWLLWRACETFPQVCALVPQSSHEEPRSRESIWGTSPGPGIDPTVDLRVGNLIAPDSSYSTYFTSEPVKL